MRFLRRCMLDAYIAYLDTRYRSESCREGCMSREHAKKDDIERGQFRHRAWRLYAAH